MNILFIINSFSKGGAEKLVYDLSLQMCNNVDAISVVGLYNASPEMEESMRMDLERKGIKTYVLGKRAKKDRFKSIKQICNIIKKDRISIIHVHCGVMILGKIAGFLTRVPVICTVHNTRGYCAIEERTTSWMSKAYVSIGQAAEEYMIKELRIPISKITRIYNGINVHKAQSGKKTDNFWKQFGLWNTGDIALLSVARIHPQKNHLCMLRAIYELKKQGLNRYKLYLVGPYDKEDVLYKQLTDYVQEHQLKEQVYFLGPQNNVADFLANADCFLMTSWYEGLSLAFLEAVISGIPIICTDMPFVHNLNKISVCASVIAQDDSVTLAEILVGKKFVSFPLASQIFAEQFSIENCAQKHLEVYKKVCL